MTRNGSTTDKVIYDCTMRSAPNEPYRSYELYRHDMMLASRAKVGAPVQIIKEHGDLTWTNATKVRMENVPHSDGQCSRFVVTLADGTEHMVSEDRIRI